MRRPASNAQMLESNNGPRGKPEALPGRYLYAVISSAAAKTFGPLGIDAGLVYCVSHGPVAAVVSNVPHQQIRPERRHLAAHQGVLKRLMAERALLPMSFGIIADGPKAIQKILSRHQVALVKQLQRVAGKVEMGLRVTWEVPNIFDYFVNTHPELRAMRDEFFGPTSRPPSQENKIEIGRLFDRLLNEDREVYCEQVEEILSRHCVEIKRHKPRNEREVMNLACLVRQEDQAQFEAGVFEGAARFDHNFAFDYSGPWPPASFVDLSLNRKS
jgi:hypothetical protein